MDSSKDPACLQLLHSDSSLRGSLNCLQDGRSLGTGHPAMRDHCSSQQKPSPALPRETPDQSPAMDLRHSGPSGAEEGASCTEGPSGSLSCPSSTCTPPSAPSTKETLGAQGALLSGTIEITLSGKPEPKSPGSLAPTSSENRNPTLLEKTDSKSSLQAGPASAGKEEAGSSKAEPLLTEKRGPAVSNPGDVGAPGRMGPPNPGKEDPESVRKADPTCTSKVALVSPGQEDPGSLQKVGPVFPSKEEPKPPKSSEKVVPAPTAKEDFVFSGKQDPGPPGKANPASLESTKHTSTGKTEDSELSEKLEPISSGIGDPGAPRGVDTAHLGAVGPTSLGNAEKEDGESLGKAGTASSGGGPGPVRMTEGMAAVQVDPGPGKMDPTSVKSRGSGPSSEPGAVSLGKVGLVCPGKPEPSSPGQAEERGSVGKTGTSEPLGKADPEFSRSAESTAALGNVSTSSSGKANRESLGRDDLVSSSPGDPDPPGTRGPPYAVENAPGTGGKAESQPEAGPLASGKVDAAHSGDLMATGKPAVTPKEKMDPGMALETKGNPVSSAEAETEASRGTKPKPGHQPQAVQDPGQEGTAPSGAAETQAPPSEQSQASGKADPTSSSGNAQPSASWIAEPRALGKAGFASETPALATAAPLTPEKPSPCPSPRSAAQACSPTLAPTGTAQGSGVPAAPEPVRSPQAASSRGSTDLVGSGPRPEAAAPPSGPRTRDNFTKAPSWDAGGPPAPLPPAREDAGTQAGARACVSVAVSPMSPQDGAGAPAFSFQGTPRAPSPAPGPPSRRDAGLQVSLGTAETRSVATGPMTPQAAAPPSAPPVFPEVRVRPGSALAAALAPQEAAEPVRDVKWDEKGMTWEVYGASMEVEVLGMAIQKHLERQIEEHGRQGGPAPPVAATATTTATTTAARAGPGRAGSVRTAPPEAEAKRPPGLFRALLQSVRRPRCCSRAGPTAE
ncbi:G protein-regulated inducer of neurite outgrowth 1-like [Perognathus longimembris pacificus]|uniref:G protein-regulated inducer of neurite outgrowth 1 n=1 Tax=Perognathus longimembris pacificus TaxID=214514 RepID=UPI0020192F64|nr:G protein-regulated inducer of neurite outgrowth 1 [Perognathus longimembris pacificus]XP_048193309.1 G protein-regulated inducer of neurite outgrowth 1-like [Perognathus longimembris pacificus]